VLSEVPEYKGTVPVYVWLWLALVVTDSVAVWECAFPPEISPTVCVWLTAAAVSNAELVRIEMVPEDAPRFATV
jgi:hypothetical protein